MIDISSEDLIRLEDIRDFLPSSRKGKRLSKAIAFRWAGKGVRGIRLETVKVGGARLTSVQSVQRFVNALNTQPPSPGQPVVRRGYAKRAAEQLTELGI